MRNFYYSLSTIDLSSVDLTSDFNLTISFNEFVSEELSAAANAFESTLQLAESFNRTRRTVRGLACITYRLRAIQNVLLVELHSWNTNVFEVVSSPQLPDGDVTVALPTIFDPKKAYAYDEEPIVALGKTWGVHERPQIVV